MTTNDDHNITSENEEFRNLFNNYEPELSSMTQFMDKLRHSLDAVEFVKQRNMAMRRRNRLALVIATLAGFLSGVILTLALPYFVNLFSVTNVIIPRSGLIIDLRIVTWGLIAVVSVVISLNTYEAIIAKMTQRRIGEGVEAR